MSYIDTIEHELVGYFNGLPIYHPLETINTEKWGAYDFSCSPQNLVIGGGAGEHPALVIHNLENLVIGFLLLGFEKIITMKEEGKYHCGFDIPSEELIESLDEMLYENDSECLEFCNWSMKNIKDFVDLAKSPLHSTPLSDEKDSEEWIKNSIGEFIYYSLPELNPLHKNIIDLIGNKNSVGYWMLNVTCPPPNFIKSKKESLQADSFKRHGFFRWDYSLPTE